MLEDGSTPFYFPFSLILIAPFGTYASHLEEEVP